MAGIPEVRRKSILVADGDEEVHHAVLEYRRDRAVPSGLSGKAAFDGVEPELVELTLGGASWMVELRALESVVAALRDSQEYYADAVV